MKTSVDLIRWSVVGLLITLVLSHLQLKNSGGVGRSLTARTQGKPVGARAHSRKEAAHQCLFLQLAGRGEPGQAFHHSPRQRNTTCHTMPAQNQSLSPCCELYRYSAFANHLRVKWGGYLSRLVVVALVGETNQVKVVNTKKRVNVDNWLTPIRFGFIISIA